MSFRESKNKRGEQLKKLQHAARELVQLVPRARIDLHVQEQLKRTGKHRLAEQLNKCGRGQYCGNIYCKTCRDRMAVKLLDRFKTQLTYSPDRSASREEYSRDNLRFVTVLHGLVPADKHEVTQAQDRARKEYRNFSTKWGVWYQGAFEYELVDMAKVVKHIADAGSQSRKKDSLLRMAGVKPNLIEDKYIFWTDKDGRKRTDYILLHTHFLMDCGKNDWEDISANIRRRWSGKNDVDISTLYDFSIRTLDDSLYKLASYPFKNRVKYHYDFGNFDWEKGSEDFEDRNAFNANELLTLFEIYKHMMGSKRTGHLLSANARA
jgi:hypothetical protein